MPVTFEVGRFEAGTSEVVVTEQAEHSLTQAAHPHHYLTTTTVVMASRALVGSS